MVSRFFGERGNTPLRGTSPKVVFKPRTPQQAAGTRIDPAVSEPYATSASSFPTETADPLDEPPGMRNRSKGLIGVPKNSFIPVVPRANSVRFVLPMMVTSGRRAVARHLASRVAGGDVVARYCDPAVVTSPFMSIMSLTARRSLPDSFFVGQYEMNARSSVTRAVRPSGRAQP